MRLLRRLTGKPGPEALREILLAYLNSRIRELKARVEEFESKYGMGFEEFREKMGKGLPLDWEHERDGMEWEEAVTLLKYYLEMGRKLQA